MKLIMSFSLYSNVLLVFVPISWATHFAWVGSETGTQSTLIFIFSFLAVRTLHPVVLHGKALTLGSRRQIIPLASLLSMATEEMALRVGQTLGGLLNATLGNAVELIGQSSARRRCGWLMWPLQCPSSP